MTAWHRLSREPSINLQSEGCSDNLNSPYSCSLNCAPRGENGQSSFRYCALSCRHCERFRLRQHRGRKQWKLRRVLGFQQSAHSPRCRSRGPARLQELGPPGMRCSADISKRLSRGRLKRWRPNPLRRRTYAVSSTAEYDRLLRHRTGGLHLDHDGLRHDAGSRTGPSGGYHPRATRADFGKLCAQHRRCNGRSCVLSCLA